MSDVINIIIAFISCIGTITPFILTKLKNDQSTKNYNSKLQIILEKFKNIINEIPNMLLCNYDSTRNDLYKDIIIQCYLLPIIDCLSEYLFNLNTLKKKFMISKVIEFKDYIIFTKKQKLDELLNNKLVSDYIYLALFISYDKIISLEIDTFLSKPYHLNIFIDNIYTISFYHYLTLVQYIKILNGELDGLIYKEKIISYYHHNDILNLFNKISKIIEIFELIESQIKVDFCLFVTNNDNVIILSTNLLKKMIGKFISNIL